MINIHFNFTDGSEVSYEEGRELIKQNVDFTTCCLSFFQMDLFNEGITVIRRLKDGGSESIFMDDLMNYQGKHTDKEIRFSHNVEKMLRANSFSWAKDKVPYVNKLLK